MAQYRSSAHLARMAQPMKPDEPAHPVQVGLLGAQAVVGFCEKLGYKSKS
jgi:hypothetical protein